jgi:hypothetical protein
LKNGPAVQGVLASANSKEINFLGMDGSVKSYPIENFAGSFDVYNSTFTDNRAIGRGANPARNGTPGGGSGGAIYADGNDFTVLVAGSTMTGNHAREGGGAIFFVSNDRTGDLLIRSSKLKNNPSDVFENSPGIYFLGDRRVVEDSVIR